MMKKPIIFLLLFAISLVPLIQAHRYYGQGLYGAGNYGTNTEPSIISYQPIVLSFEMNYTDVNMTFNITAIDYDLDKLHYNWTINGTHNDTFIAGSRNLSVLLNMTPATYNITVNVSDNQSHAFVSWILTIKNISASPEVSPAQPSGGGGTPVAPSNQWECMASENMTWYNGVCYECSGTLVEEDGEVMCAKCPTGFNYLEGKCESIVEQTGKVIPILIFGIIMVLGVAVFTTQSKRKQKETFKRMMSDLQKEKGEKNE